MTDVGIAWDGRYHAYIPPEELKINPNLKLHKHVSAKVDPITFEVIRHKLWSINSEHGNTLAKLAVSPIAVITRDFQPSILTESGEYVFFGPYLQYMTGVVDVVIKWILENRSHNPGIKDGDMFLSNDPWVGASHQPDVLVLCPVFREGELFCWVANCMHQSDIGGITPGSFCAEARDVWDDPVCFMPFKIVEDNQIRSDMEDVYTRQSRLPFMVSSDLRAAVSGNLEAKKQIIELCERYGAETVKGTMQKVIQSGEEAFVQKLRQIPDGRWSERIYNETARGGDRGTYRIQLNLTKRGDQLIFDNQGTELQSGAINITYACWRGTIMSVLNPFLCHEQMGAFGGANRRIKFSPVPGTLTCANYGAAVSPAGVWAAELSIATAVGAIGKMMSCAPDKIRNDLITNGAATWGGIMFTGFDQRGNFCIGPMTDSMAGALGATPAKDGITAGGHIWIPDARGNNVEDYEQIYPILYLFKKVDVDSGGAGRFRGGNGAIQANIPYCTAGLSLDAYTSEVVPKSIGLSGGYPGSPCIFGYQTNTNIKDLFANGRVPLTYEEVEGIEGSYMSKGSGVKVDDHSCWYWNWGSAAGYGDPLSRDPEQVRQDVVNGEVSRQAAQDVYGVALTENFDLERDLTTKLREHKRQARIRMGEPVKDALSDVSLYQPKVLHKVGDLIKVIQDDGDKYFVCSHCGAVLARTDQNYKEACLIIEQPTTQAGPRYEDTKRFVDDEMVFRQFVCPQCGSLFDSEVCRKGEEILWDYKL